MVNSVRNARQSISANGVPITKPAPRHMNRSTTNPALRHAASRVRTSLKTATTAGSATSAVLYFVDAASPDSRPAVATRMGVTPRVAHLTAARNAHIVTNVAGTSV